MRLEFTPPADDGRRGGDPRREAMVRDDLAGRDIADPRVLDAFRRVPRHEFVPAHLQREAYHDHPLPIGHGQTISQPYIVAWMAQWAEIGPAARVLEIGTGCGYQTAILAELAAEVCSIEIVGPLLERARAILARLGYDRVRLREGDGRLGWPEAAPFDAIVVSAAAARVSPAWVEQLAEGGRLVLPVQEGPGWQALHRLTRQGARCRDEPGPAVRFVPLV